MPEQLSIADIALRDRAEAFIQSDLHPTHSKVDAGTLTAEQARQKIVDASKAAGFFALTQPRSFGGTEASNLTLCVLRDTFAAANNPLSRFLFGPGPGVLADCDDQLAQTYLKPLLQGEKRGAFAFTEPEQAQRPTWASVQGDALVINGAKSFVTGGGDADFLNTLVQIENQGPALVVIDRRFDGVELTQQFDTLDGSHHAAFEFSHVHVPLHHIIGKPGEGLPRAMRQIGNIRLSMAAEAVGSMRWVIDFLSRHLQAPHRSGEPLASKEGVRLRYADLRIDAFAARSMVYRAARLADTGENIVNEAIASKVFATEALGHIVDTAIQLCGGTALTVGHPLEALYRRVRATRLAEGANDVLRLNLARGALELDKGRL